MSDERKPIAEIDGDAKYGDLVLLEIPTEINAHAGEVSGIEYATGFFFCCNADFVLLAGTQKTLLGGDSTTYARKDITAYEILRRFELNVEDGLDRQLIDLGAVPDPRDEEE